MFVLLHILHRVERNQESEKTGSKKDKSVQFIDKKKRTLPERPWIEFSCALQYKKPYDQTKCTPGPEKSHTFPYPFDLTGYQKT
jgi:hypothetical protein